MMTITPTIKEKELYALTKAIEALSLKFDRRDK